jgi:hypothetical protein
LIHDVGFQPPGPTSPVIHSAPGLSEGEHETVKEDVEKDLWMLFGVPAKNKIKLIKVLR